MSALKASHRVPRALFFLAVLSVAGLLVVATAARAAAWETTLEVVDGGAHCDTTNGNHWAWDVRIIPGSAVEGTPTVVGPWTVQNVTGPTAGDRLIIHLVSTEPEAGPVTITVNGEPYEVAPTLHPSDKCPGVPPLPDTCETDESLCSPPPPEVIPPVVPPVELVPPVVETAAPQAAPEVFSAPVAVAATPTARPAALAYTGPREVAAESVAGCLLLAAGLLFCRKGSRRTVGLIR